MATMAGDIKDIVVGLEKVNFHHPYTPYDVQEQFMKTVYNVLEAGDGQVGILESPTGTVSVEGMRIDDFTLKSADHT